MASTHWHASSNSLSRRGGLHVALTIKPPTLALLVAVMVALTVVLGAYAASEAPPIVERQGRTIADSLNEIGRGSLPPASNYRGGPVSYEHMYDARVESFNVDHMYGRRR